MYPVRNSSVYACVKAPKANTDPEMYQGVAGVSLKMGLQLLADWLSISVPKIIV